ncbi:MAG: hypothetical protein HN509_16905 [Halobacteriovoraceae bacterium]|jgi:hypothetical protein|nr:hypothetical protein [Halobacteriovoraceae bacterium]
MVPKKLLNIWTHRLTGLKVSRWLHPFLIREFRQVERIQKSTRSALGRNKFLKTYLKRF